MKTLREIATNLQHSLLEPHNYIFGRGHELSWYDRPEAGRAAVVGEWQGGEHLTVAIASLPVLLAACAQSGDPAIRALMDATLPPSDDKTPDARYGGMRAPWQQRLKDAALTQ